MMRDLNGDEFLKVIKSDPDQRDIPVVMISADTNADKVSQCIELGADDYLPKPFNPTILRARIGAALRNRWRARGGAIWFAGVVTVKSSTIIAIVADKPRRHPMEMTRRHMFSGRRALPPR